MECYLESFLKSDLQFENGLDKAWCRQCNSMTNKLYFIDPNVFGLLSFHLSTTVHLCVDSISIIATDCLRSASYFLSSIVDTLENPVSIAHRTVHLEPTTGWYRNSAYSLQGKLFLMEESTVPADNSFVTSC